MLPWGVHVLPCFGQTLNYSFIQLARTLINFKNRWLCPKVVVKTTTEGRGFGGPHLHLRNQKGTIQMETTSINEIISLQMVDLKADNAPVGR